MILIRSNINIEGTMSYNQPKILLSALLTTLGSLSAHASCTDLFISEYIEGGSSNKAIEIFNPTDASIDLSAYTLELYSNGATSASNPLTLSGTLASHEVYVIANSGAIQSIKDQADTLHSVTNFNGDDALVLRNGTAVIDSIGRVGERPSPGWGNSTANKTLVRKASITQGDATSNDAFDPATEFDIYDQDTVSYLGAHTFDGCGALVTLGIAISGAPLAISESGTADSYTIALKTVPESVVDIAIDVTDGQTLISSDDVSFGVSLEFNLSDTTPVTVYVRAIDDTLIENAHQGIITHRTFSSDGNYSALEINATANITDNDYNQSKIHEIQGSGAASASVGQTVSITAIVVGDFQNAALGTHGDLDGFFVQEEDGDADGDAQTSEGIFVYDGSNPSLNVTTGDQVRVVGKVAEYNGLTELTNIISVEILSPDNTLPTPASVTLPLGSLDQLEAFEGMSVAFDQTLHVTEHYTLGRYGKVLLSSSARLDQPTNVALPGDAAVALQAQNDLNQILLDDGLSIQNPATVKFSHHAPNPLSAVDTLRGGDSVNGLLGALYYANGAYNVQPTAMVDFNNTNPRPTTAPNVGGSLKVAAFNVLNYFTTVDAGPAICGPLNNQDCRGANSETELTRQQTKLLAALGKLQADVIGMMELENTDQAALATLVSHLEGYGYIANPAGLGVELGGDAITVGLMYKTEKVTPVGTAQTVADGYGSTDLGAACGGGSDGIYPFDNFNRKPLAQTFRDNATGELFTVVVNHLKSKGSLTGYADDVDQLDGQGANNCTRSVAAQTLLEWLATDPTQNGHERFIIMGDLNAYAMEDPITVLKNAGYTNQVSGYSYVFDGQWGSLDHVLTSPALSKLISGGAKWHINADEPIVLDYNTEFKSPDQLNSFYGADEYRTSDHDPVMIGLNLKKRQMNPNILMYLLN